MKHAVEILWTLSTTFKASADQQSVDTQTEISLSLLGHDNLFSQIYMTRPEGQTQVIDQSISLICLGLLSANLLASVQISMLHNIRIKMRFMSRYVYTYEDFVFMIEATAVQQNDSDIMLLLLTYLIFSTHAWSVKREGHNLTKKENANIADAAVVTFLCGYARQ